MLKRITTLAALASLAIPSAAQVISNDVPRSRLVPLRSQVETQLTKSMIRLGPLRLQPTLELRNVGYYDNVFGAEVGEEPESDFGGTVAAGADLLLPMGEKAFLRGFAMPEYTYFLDIEELRGLSGSYGGELLLLFNQMSIQTGVISSETLRPVSSEVEAPATVSTDTAFAITEIELARRLSLYAAGETSENRVDEEDGIEIGPVERLDRDTTVLQGGFRYDVRSYFQISALYETTEVEHAVNPLKRDYETTAILGGIHYDTARFYLNLSAGPREIESTNPNAFEGYSTVTGSAYAAYEMGAPAVLSLFGNRSLRASAFVENAIFIEDRIGTELETRLGERARLRFGGGIGQNDYPLDTGLDRPKRVDDTEILTAGLSWRLFREVWLSVDATETDYDSNIDTYDRNILRVQTTISIR